MNDKYFLKYCLNEIEKKLEWGKSNFWKDRDFIKLSEIISETSKISISAHTLKRLYGKIKYVESYNPQEATRNALAIFLEYDDWDDYVRSQKQLKGKAPFLPKSESEITKKHLQKIIIIFGVLFAFILLGTLVISNQTKKTKTDFKFLLKDSIGAVPYTISIDYDVSKIQTDSIYVDYNFINPNSGARIVKLNKLKSVNNFTYQIPGYYSADLKIDKQVISTKNVLALSTGWDSYVLPEGDTHTFWINNKLEAHTENGHLYYSPEIIKKNGFNYPVFYVANRLFKQFEIDGDNFELEARFKNNEALGGITCYNFSLNLICTNETNYFSLMEDGCSLFSRIKIGDKIVGGMDHDLSNFKIDTQDWNIFFVKVKNKKAQVYINKELIFEAVYNSSNGKIVGIENIFKGCGLLDYIKIKDLNTKKVFLDDFLNSQQQE